VESWHAFPDLEDADVRWYAHTNNEIREALREAGIQNGPGSDNLTKGADINSEIPEKKLDLVRIEILKQSDLKKRASVENIIRTVLERGLEKIHTMQIGNFLGPSVGGIESNAGSL
jgi:hypothetical protein